MIQKKGDYVVYLKNGDMDALGKVKKDIWIVTDIYSDRYQHGVDITATLESISSDKRFSTNTDNLITTAYLQSRNKFRKEYFNSAAYAAYMKEVAVTKSNTFKKEYEAKFTNDKEVGDTNMRSNKTVVKRTTDANVDAAKVGAMVATGRTVNAVVLDKVRDKLPLMARGYADTAFGAVILANIVDFGIKQYFADNAKFNYVSDAMMQAAMVDLMAEFDFEGMINDILSNVSLGDITEQEA